MPFKYPLVMLLYIPVAMLTVWLIRKNFVKFRNLKERDEFVRRNRFIKRYLIVSRLLIFLLFFLAFASPFILEEKPIKGDLSLTILTDNSTSFELFDQALASRLKGKLEQSIPTTVKTIATGEFSAIGDGLLTSIQGNDNVLIITDGNNNAGKDLGDVILFAKNLNTTISTLDLKPMHDDTNVVIEGASEAIVGSESTFFIKVQQVGNRNEYRLAVDIDGRTVLEQSSSGPNIFSVTETLGEGYHRVTAKVVIEDYFPQNNVFYKTIQIIKKPNIMFISKTPSRMQEKLAELYHVFPANSVPENLKEYAAVILNNFHSTDISNREVDGLTDYVTDGYGLIVVGGKNAFDKGAYKDSLFETLLPVKSGKGEKEEQKDISIVVVIDISGSTGGQFAQGSGPTKVDVEKALAISILDSIKAEDKVGVVAFNEFAFVLSPLQPVGEVKEELKDTIARLQFGGGTDITVGIRRAEELLLRGKGSMNIILISDGITFDPLAALKEAQRAHASGMDVYTVGVGFDTFEILMKEIANVGHGIYFKPEHSERLKIIFGDPEDKTGKGLVILNNNHFITQDLELSGSVLGFNQVVPKSSANLLVTTGEGQPILTVWRFGLGRVAALSTDAGEEWAGDLLSRENSRIISRTINWVIGDPSKKGLDIITEDTSLGKSTDIIVKSDRQPVSREVEFVKIDKDLYKATFTPAETGFYQFLDAAVAVNYHEEYEDIGLNEQLKTLVTATGGEVFQEDDIASIVEKIKSVSQRLETQEVSLRWPFATAALFLFLLEVFIRRLREFKKQRA
ncbi:VWA domain-containing protein [Candidatus Woesearchaeota archaeon]|nr:VWA domain-containing protein [Candidatus Woesearchaeota archaeon]